MMKFLRVLPRGTKEQQKKWRDAFHARNPGYQKRASRQSRYKKEYGITIEDYERILEAQGGICAICGAEPDSTEQLFHVDHNHDTKQVRGILCGRCNPAVRDPDWHRKAIAYLIEKDDKHKWEG
jgi:hypothetical protein